MTREEIKNIVRHVFHFYEVNAENCNWTDMNEACGEIFKALEQEPKTGYWIEHPHEAGVNWEYSRYECSECHVWEDDDSDYCPNCGSKMVEPQESEDKE